MAFAQADTRQDTISEMNITPLVDVMLVLLIIFIITAPLMTHSVQVDLPRASSTPTPQKPLSLQLSISADGELFLNGGKLAEEALERRLNEAVLLDRAVELHLMADSATRYEIVAKTMSAARRAGVAKIGFVTQPSENGSQNHR